MNKQIVKRLLFIAVVLIFFACGQSVDRKSGNQLDNDSVKTEVELIDFEGNAFTVGYPSTWTLNQKEMDNESSVAQITANYKISDNRAITFQIINLVDTASLEIGVKNLIKKYSRDAIYTDFIKTEINKNVFINTRIKFAINVSSESYFLKDGDNLFWLTFMGHVIDLDKRNHEIRSIVESFELKKAENK
jgi:hypothetical protein